MDLFSKIYLRAPFLASAGRKFLKKQGFVLVDSKKYMKLRDLVDFLKCEGIEISLIYDIGANVGNWSRNFKEVCGNQIQIIMFEPNPYHNSELKKVAGSNFFNILLSDKEGVVDFFSNNSTGDSMNREESIYYNDVIPIKMLTQSLDAFTRDNSISQCDLIKIDVQGSELLVLKGATRILENTKVVIVETRLVSKNHNAPSISEVTDFMIFNNYVPISIMEIHLADYVLTEIDLIFLKRDLIAIG
jgi:FkbM family methyltransferase